MDTGPRAPGGRHQFWIDRGGTFTDVVARAARRRAASRTSCCRRIRSSTATPRSQASAGCSGSAPDEPIPPSSIDAVKMGTTVATNALLERKGEPTAAVDHARLSRRAAHRLPEPAAAVRPPHRAARAAVQRGDRGRRAHRRARRACCAPLDEAALRAELRDAFARGFRAVAIVLHARLPLPAARAARGRARARDRASRRSRVSHEVSPLMKLVSRGDTTVVDAYLSPILRRYVAQVAGELRPAASASAVLHEVERRPDRRAALSGQGLDPVRARRAASSAWCARRSPPASTSVIGFDMGGTSTDVLALRRRASPTASASSTRRWPACACARR